MKPRNVLLILGILLVAVSALFLLWGLNEQNMAYNLPRRSIKLAAIAVTGSAVAFSTVSFQTIVGNNILTPSIIGLDSLYLFIQTLVVFTMGANQLAMMSRIQDFLLSVGVMVGFSLLLYRLMFRREGTRLFMIILTGVMLGSLFSSLATFMQVMIDPNEFLVVQASMFASFNNVNTEILGIASTLMAASVLYGWAQTRQLDVLSLGRDISINLGISYDHSIRRTLILVAIMTAISTALVGPITFLGLLVANLAKQILPTYRHRIIVPGAILLALIALIGGQFLVERVFSFNTPISVIINFVGGIYFLYLLVREGRV